MLKSDRHLINKQDSESGQPLHVPKFNRYHEIFSKRCLPLNGERVRNPVKTFPADVVGHCDLELVPEARQILPEGFTSGRQCTASGWQGCIVAFSFLPLLTLLAMHEDFLVFVVDLEVGDGEIYHRDYERRYRNCHRVHKVHVHLRKRFKHVTRARRKLIHIQSSSTQTSIKFSGKNPANEVRLEDQFNYEYFVINYRNTNHKIQEGTIQYKKELER